MSVLRIIVDTNAAEHELFRHTERHAQDNIRWGADKRYELQVMRKRLDLGDAVAEYNGSRIVFERKEWSDWANSIQDGRYREQKVRFLANDDSSSRLVYLINSQSVPPPEGAVRKFPNKASHAALLKTVLRDGFPVLWANDMAHAGWTIAYVAHQFACGGFLSGTSNVGGDTIVGMDRSKVTKRKRDNLVNNTSQMFASMLCVVPGMSDKKAMQIARLYPTANALCQASVSDLSNVDCNGRKLGPVLGARLHAIFSKSVA